MRHHKTPNSPGDLLGYLLLYLGLATVLLVITYMAQGQ